MNKSTNPNARTTWSGGDPFGTSNGISIGILMLPRGAWKLRVCQMRRVDDLTLVRLRRITSKLKAF